jgi:hypothetical protein
MSSKHKKRKEAFLKRKAKREEELNYRLRLEKAVEENNIEAAAKIMGINLG